MIAYLHLPRVKKAAFLPNVFLQAGAGNAAQGPADWQMPSEEQIRIESPPRMWGRALRRVHQCNLLIGKRSNVEWRTWGQPFPSDIQTCCLQALQRVRGTASPLQQRPLIGQWSQPTDGQPPVYNHRSCICSSYALQVNINHGPAPARADVLHREAPAGNPGSCQVVDRLAGQTPAYKGQP